MKLKVFFLLICFSLLCGCAIKQPYEIYDTQFSNNSSKGILLCSIIHSKYWSGHPTTSYYVRRIGTDEKIRVFGHNKLLQGVFGVKGEIEDDGPGSVKILELPEGKYEIFSWNMFFNHGTIQWTECSEKEFSIPFEVKADCINYIGQIRLKDYQISFSDKSERDLRIAYGRNYGIDGLEINKQKLEFASNFKGRTEKKDEFIYIPPLIN